jgi:hypothetical protein
MRSPRQLLYSLALASALLSHSIAAQTQSSPSASSSVANRAKPVRGQKCTDNGAYVNSKGQTVPRPENCSGSPEGATAQCRDGSYSFSRSRRATCLHHSGVAKWL